MLFVCCSDIRATWNDNGIMGNVTFKPVVYAHQKRADGTYNVKIRMTLHRVSRNLPTTITATPDDLTRSLKLKTGPVLYRANDLIRQMQEVLATLPPFSLDTMTADDAVNFVKKRMTSGEFRLNFFDFADEFIAKKSATAAGFYVRAVRGLLRFTGSRDLDVNEISYRMLTEFCEFYQNETTRGTARNAAKMPGSSSPIMSALHAVYKAARDKYNDEDTGYIPIPRDPFARLHLEQPKFKGQRAMDEKTLQTIIDYRTGNRVKRRAVDLFLLSYLLMGANLADLVEAVPPSGDVWEYCRRKTRNRRDDDARIKVKIPPEAAPYISRLKKGAREGRWLEAGGLTLSANTTCNRSLKDVAAELGLPPFTFYAARKSFATIARRQGVEKATIDECLCHVGGYRVADIYIERDWELMWKAQRKAIDALRWDAE